MEKTVVGGVFQSSEEALKAIERLRDIGFDPNDISVMAKDKDKVEELDERTSADVMDESSKRGSNAGRGLGIGAGSGGVLGGIAGLIAEVGLLTIPGIGVLAAAGPLATTLSGAAIGATGGGIVGALTGAGIPKENAKEYEKYLKEGNILLLVDIDEKQREEIQRIFSDSHSVSTDVYVVDTK
ncbi:general stress protein [Planococcus halotolerans]|uniref:general stress protein n=1 Tax=Planococcus halotolerans TaxID=2233542 RepID=UPI001091D9FA|nr:general stress protein [Planococcus halotolerans]QHJ70073.1 low temperature-induced protein [Planococcus halotolerans]